MDEMIRLEKRKRELEDAIHETEKRLPAHSVKPPVMMDLLAYEDEYERVVAAIRTLRDNGKTH
jgi:HAMP domain-containing protein